MARIILLGYENFGKDAERMLVHCKRGNNCSLAVGIAMNGVFGWEINGLKERFPNYRRFVYKIMMDVGKGFRNI